MKSLIQLYFATLSLAYCISYGQSTTSEIIASNNIKNSTNETVSLMDYSTVSDIQEEEIHVNPEININPEPFEGLVSVNLNALPDAQVSVFDANGKSVKKQQCAHDERALFDLRKQPKGIYYLEIKVKGEKTVKAIYLQQNF
ncbi:MAG: T9SS type A sorting domain-containing protein [Bacteroidota bacterium]